MIRIPSKDTINLRYKCSGCKDVRVGVSNGKYFEVTDGTDQTFIFALCEHCLVDFCDVHKLTVDYRHT